VFRLSGGTSWLSHLRLPTLRFGLLIDFHEERLIAGVSRIVNGCGSQAVKS
jgi:hypothetical protein